MYNFIKNSEYTRKDIFNIIGISDPNGGSWYTGYTSHQNDFFIFCHIDSEGRTGHNYGNYFDDQILIWFGNNKSKIHQPVMQRLIKPIGKIYIFYRYSSRGPFTFAGQAYPIHWKDSTPVQISWAFYTEETSSRLDFPEEIMSPEKVIEGAKKTITVNTYERDSSARRKCISYWGTSCCICSFNFEDVYGELGKNYIHVHHVKPLSELSGEYELDPINDLRPVCPNCHSMLHRGKPALSIEHVKNLIK